MNKILVVFLILSLIPLILSFILEKNLISYYLLFSSIFFLFSLLIYFSLKKLEFIEFSIRRYKKLSYENPYERKREMIKKAIEGSKISRIVLGEILREAIERKYGFKITPENAEQLIKDKEIIAVLFYRDFPLKLNDREYIRVLNKVISIAW